MTQHSPIRIDTVLQQDKALAQALERLGPAAGGATWVEAERDARAAVWAAVWRAIGQVARARLAGLAALVRQPAPRRAAP